MAAPRPTTPRLGSDQLKPGADPGTWLERWKRRRVKLTREGKYFLGIAGGVFFAAINTGNNLLYLLLGMLISLLIVSGVLSDLSLRSLTVVRRLPTRAQVGRSHLIEIEVFNHKSHLPSYAIEVEDLREGQPADKRCFFLKISPRAAQVAAYRRIPARRGRDNHIAFRIATRFPFGLFEKSREIRSDGSLVIYPAIDPVHLPTNMPGMRVGGSGALGRGGGDEIVGVRLMREGDDPRDIYWRKSTSAEQMVLLERARDTRLDVTLVVEDQVPNDESKEAWAARFERTIRDVASRSVAHLKRGDTVIIKTTSGRRVLANKQCGADPALRFLALLEPAEPDNKAHAEALKGAA